MNLLFVLFNLHPWNTCQPTHVDPLVRIYRGTLSISDRKLLSIFQLFEAQRKASVGSLLVRWSSSADIPSNNILDAVQNLDAIRVLRTCLTFPKWRRFEDQLQEGEHLDIQIYDPVFLILIFTQMLADSPPDSAFAWVEVFRTNIVGLLIRSLSSKDGRIREVAIPQIAALWRYIEVRFPSLFVSLILIFDLGCRYARKAPCDVYPKCAKRCHTCSYLERIAPASTIVYDSHLIACPAGYILSIKLHISSYSPFSIATT